MPRKILGTTKPEEQQRKEFKYDEANLKKAQKYADAFFNDVQGVKLIAPMHLSKIVSDYIKENCDKKIEKEIEYLIFRKWAEN
jgi:hypothetical protein